MFAVIAGMLAISTFVVGTTYIIQLVPRGILIFRLSNILNLHIYQGYTSLYDSLHDFITHYKLHLMRLLTLMKLTQNTEECGPEKIIGNPSFFGSDRSSRSHNLRSFVCPVVTCLKLHDDFMMTS